MTRMTAHEIEAAMETLRTSYSYDPPERWAKAHSALRTEKAMMEPEVRPYAWIRWAIVIVDIVLGLAIYIVGLRLLFGSDPLLGLWLVLVGAPTGIIPLYAECAQLYFASRRHPTARFKADIDGLVSVFDKRLERLTQEATT